MGDFSSHASPRVYATAAVLSEAATAADLRRFASIYGTAECVTLTRDVCRPSSRPHGFHVQKTLANFHYIFESFPPAADPVS